MNECNFTIEELRKRFDLSGWVLEPSFGSGNFVSELKKYDLNIDCFEIDPEVFSSIDGANCFLGDFLLSDFDKQYDFIIGNPPYIELVYSYYDEDDKSKLRERFNFEKRGRINLVHLFMDKSFELLKDGGVLAYLLPSTILSSPWYNDIRKKIYDEYLFTKTEFRRFPKHVQEANKALKRYVAGFTFFKYSGLQTVSENQIKYEVLNFDTKQKIINGNIVDKDYSFFFYFSITVSGISFVILCILLVVDGWSFSEARLKTISRWIYCELEEDVYYYFFDDRFLGKSNNDLKGKLYRLEVSSLSDIRLRPVFKTKSMKREDKLDELLK